MADCPYCLETENASIVKNLYPDNQVEIKVVACIKPYLMIRYYNNGWWSIGMRIKYCPMCGRRLSDG